MRGAEVPLRAPPQHPHGRQPPAARRPPRWGRGRQRLGEGFPARPPPAQIKIPTRPCPRLYPSLLVRLDCDVSGLKGVKMF